MKLLFFVSLPLVVLLSGCATYDKGRGVLTTHFIGQVIESGYTERSGILLTNTQPNLTMKVTISTFELSPHAFRGNGRDPLLGTPPRRIPGDTATYVTRLSQGGFVPCPGIVMPRGGVEVTATWHDESGVQVGKPAGAVFFPWNAEIWKFQWAPRPGECSNEWWLR
jgi:hypothetical protein